SHYASRPLSAISLCRARDCRTNKMRERDARAAIAANAAQIRLCVKTVIARVAQVPELAEAFAKQRSQKHETRQILSSWRREWDSNPRYGFPYTRFPSVRLKPLGHPSVAQGNIALAARARNPRDTSRSHGSGTAFAEQRNYLH